MRRDRSMRRRNARLSGRRSRPTFVPAGGRSLGRPLDPSGCIQTDPGRRIATTSGRVRARSETAEGNKGRPPIREASGSRSTLRGCGPESLHPTGARCSRLALRLQAYPRLPSPSPEAAQRGDPDCDRTGPTFGSALRAPGRSASSAPTKVPQRTRRRKATAPEFSPGGTPDAALSPSASGCEADAGSLGRDAIPRASAVGTPAGDQPISIWRSVHPMWRRSTARWNARA